MDFSILQYPDPDASSVRWWPVAQHPDPHPTSPPVGMDVLSARTGGCGGARGSACCCSDTRRKLPGRLWSQCPRGGKGVDVCILFCTSLTTRRPLSPARRRAPRGIPLPPGYAAPFSPGC